MSDHTDIARESGRQTSVLLAFVAAAAGIAVASYLYWWRMKSMRQRSPSLASVGDILSQCHAKMREIQSHLSALVPE